MGYKIFATEDPYVYYITNSENEAVIKTLTARTKWFRSGIADMNDTIEQAAQGIYDVFPKAEIIVIEKDGSGKPYYHGFKVIEKDDVFEVYFVQENKIYPEDRLVFAKMSMVENYVDACNEWPDDGKIRKLKVNRATFPDSLNELFFQKALKEELNEIHML